MNIIWQSSSSSSRVILRRSSSSSSISISRNLNVLLPPLLSYRRLPSSSSSSGRSIRSSYHSSHKFLYTTRTSDITLNTSTAISTSTNNNILTTTTTNNNITNDTIKVPNSNNTSAEQTLENLHPPPTPSKFTTPTNQRNKQHNNSIFPWRHSPHPLARLTPNTLEEYEEGGEFGPNFPMRGGTMTMAERALVWGQAVYVLGLRRPWGYGRWKRELEEGFLTAFAMGLQGVLVDVYRAPTSIEDEEDEDETGDNKDDKKDKLHSDDDDNDDDDADTAYSVRMDHTIDTPIQDADDDRPSSTTKPPTTSQKKHNTKNTDTISEIQPNLHDMLETNLQSLYHSAHSTAKSKLNIRLECQPKSASLISIFTVPLLTRDEVTQDPALRNLYPDLYQKLLVKAMEEMERSDGRKTQLSWREVYGEMKEFVEDKVSSQEEEGVVQMTVVAQAMIECEEVFCVRDVELGAVVQGDKDGKMREVSHLVRFEMVVDWDWQREELQIGNWQITDWDDLLDGNIWYL